ncbi:MAG: hypothetical protein AAGH15_22865 [Myxococcota bacterium]
MSPRAPLALSLLMACGPGAAPEAPPAPSPAAPEAPAESESVESEGPGPIPASWVAERVAAAEARLGTSPGGRLVLRAVEAHGGLAAWLAKGTLEFTFAYSPLGRPEGRMHTRQQVDLWRAHARHEEIGGDAVFGWDGERAWMHPGPDAFPQSARFWSLTPYYFVGMPFVVADPGAKHEQLPDAPLNGRPHDVVKVTYDAGTGDSPDDYYVLYLDKATHRLAALRYVVAYPGFFPEGGHTPEKLMRYTEPMTVDGLVFAQRLDTYAWDPEAGEPGAKVTEIIVGQPTLGASLPADHFAPIEGAHVSTEIAATPR